MSTIKFCAFADIHYYPGVFPHDSYDWLDQILSRAEKEEVEFIIHLGDFTHCPERFMDYVEHYNNFHIPTYHILGNHDCDGNPYEKTLECYRMSNGYYFFDRNGFRFIILDPNYFKHGDEYFHYSSGNYFQHGDERDWLPPEQLVWLEKTIASAPGPCVLFSHESYEREADGIKNQAQIRAIIDEANRKCRGRVPLCINGHYHRDNIRILNNVIYFELNSASYEWVSKDHDKYPKEVLDRWKHAKNTVMFNDPINAIITLDTDGLVKIEGMESTLFMGIEREMTENPKFDAMGRPVVPRVQSMELRLTSAL